MALFRGFAGSLSVRAIATAVDLGDAQGAARVADRLNFALIAEFFASTLLHLNTSQLKATPSLRAKPHFNGQGVFRQVNSGS